MKIPQNKTGQNSQAQHQASTWIIPLGLFLVSALGVGIGVRWLGNSESRTENVLASSDSVTSTQGSEPGFLETNLNQNPKSVAVIEGMVWIPGGEFSMGCQDPTGLPNGGPDPMRDARPIHRVYVDGFYIDECEVTNAQFAEFVKATGYVTVAEQKPKAEDFPGAPPENLVAGSVVFSPPPSAVPLDNHFRWWNYVPGANWRHPEGPDSNIDGREEYPVVQVNYDDAVAYAKWAGKRLPTEAEWEFAARGGETGQVYLWGDDLNPNGEWRANTWQGEFPINDSAEDGFAGIAPGKQFPAGNYGLYDMAGNVWEWCSDWYRPDYYASLARAETVARNPQGPESGFDPAEPTEKKRVHRGGSFLCTDQYCTRYMIGSRGKGESSTGSNHVGFRCVKDPK